MEVSCKTCAFVGEQDGNGLELGARLLVAGWRAVVVDEFATGVCPACARVIESAVHHVGSTRGLRPSDRLALASRVARALQEQTQRLAKLPVDVVRFVCELESLCPAVVDRWQFEAMRGSVPSPASPAAVHSAAALHGVRCPHGPEIAVEELAVDETLQSELVRRKMAM